MSPDLLWEKVHVPGFGSRIWFCLFGQAEDLF